MKKIISAILFTVLGALCVSAQKYADYKPLPLYPNGATENSGLCRDSVRMLGDSVIIEAVDADYYLFPPDKAKATGQAILICPGGGYWGCWFGHEGIIPAKWMQEHGIYAVVLRYRMPNGHHEIPLKDVRTMMSIMRANAKEWGIDPNQIGIMGFSAGGHLAASASVFNTDAQTHPNWAILGYPVITFELDKTHSATRYDLIGKNAPEELVNRYCLERQVTEQTPPTFIMMSSEDKTVPPINATLYYNALVAHQVPVEMHMYPTGPHGFSWHKTYKYHDEMITALERWLKEQNTAAKAAKK